MQIPRFYFDFDFVRPLSLNIHLPIANFKETLRPLMRNSCPIFLLHTTRLPRRRLFPLCLPTRRRRPCSLSRVSASCKSPPPTSRSVGVRVQGCNGAAALGKTAYAIRVKSLLKSKRAQTVAKATWRTLKSVSKEVVRKKGAMARS